MLRFFQNNFCYNASRSLRTCLKIFNSLIQLYHSVRRECHTACIYIWPRDVPAYSILPSTGCCFVQHRYTNRTSPVQFLMLTIKCLQHRRTHGSLLQLLYSATYRPTLLHLSTCTRFPPQVLPLRELPLALTQLHRYLPCYSRSHRIPHAPPHNEQ
jgi:hypothetical protein